MCGIAGMFGRKADIRTVSRMVESIRHRGPDDQGIWDAGEGRVVFGHARLSIIDLSAAGHQPMVSHDKRVAIVFNGEIYNYREIRSELEKTGYCFVSHSDTEVVLAAYIQWGISSVNRLRGMFAYAIYDKSAGEHHERLFLARDRVGIKPLLYAKSENSILFASELRAFLASDMISRQVDPNALLDYLAFGNVWQPRTMLADVKALLPGCWMEILSTGESQTVRYWDLHEATRQQREQLHSVSFDDSVLMVRNALHDAARDIMVADVPVGAFLSGGIDSTAVVGLMTEASGQSIHTFAVGFEDARFKAMDERAIARAAAAHLGAVHQDVVIGERDVVEAFPSIVSGLDQPSADGANTWLVSRAARGSVKVAVSGLGGDELFAGYDHFRTLSESSDDRRTGLPWLHRLCQVVQSVFPNGLCYRGLFRSANQAQFVGMLRRTLQGSSYNQAVLSHGNLSNQERHVASFFHDDADSVQNTTNAELNRYLLSMLLRDGDVMSMAHGLEVRPLFLDHRLVELVYALPQCVKFSPTVNKPLLVKAAQSFLPDIVTQRKKMGFCMPLNRWLAGRGATDMIQPLFNSSNARVLFAPTYLKLLESGIDPNNPPSHLWSWAVLLAWGEANHISFE